MRARSVRRPSTGVRSILKSPECRITPWGVWKAVAKPCGTEWVTGMNSTSKGPIWRRSPSATSMKRGPVGEARLLHAVAGQPQGERRAVHGDRQVAEQEGEAAGVVLVAVGEDDGLDRVGCSRRYERSGSTRSMPGMSGSGNMIPQSRTTMRPSNSKTAQFRPISPRPPRKMMRTGSGKRPACRVHRLRRALGPRLAITVRACSSSSGGAARCGSRHWPAGRPRTRQAALAGAGWGTPRSSRSRRTRRAGRSTAARRRRRLCPGRHHRRDLLAGPVRRHAHHTHRAQRQQRQGQRVVAAVELETLGGLGHEPGRSRPGRRWRL